MLGKILTRLFALFGMSLTCVACYAPYGTEFNPTFEANGRVVDNEGEPIKGINCFSDRNSTSTDSLGNFCIYGDDPHLSFEDVDGADNGGEFATLTIDLEEGHGYNTQEYTIIELGDIKLERTDME